MRYTWGSATRLLAWFGRVAVEVQPLTWLPAGARAFPVGWVAPLTSRRVRRDGAAASRTLAGSTRVYGGYPGWYDRAQDWLTPAAWAVLSYRVAHRLWMGGLPTLALVISLPARIGSGADIHPQAVIGSRFRLAHGFGVVIGATAEIGDDCILLHGVTLGVRHVGQPEPVGVRVHPRLGNRVRVGAGAVLLGSITVGDGALIGANAVVLNDVPAGATAVGVPARILESGSGEEAVAAALRPACPFATTRGDMTGGA